MEFFLKVVFQSAQVLCPQAKNVQHLINVLIKEEDGLVHGSVIVRLTHI